jgi:hypothetical protein
MNLKYWITFLSVLQLLYSPAYAQVREDKKMAEVLVKSKRLNHVKGWEQNSKTGKWVSNKNAIHPNSCDNICASFNEQDFKWLELRKIRHKNEDFVALVYESISGSYEYPNIKLNWRIEKRTSFFLMTLSEYGALINSISSETDSDIFITSKIAGNISNRYRALGGEHAYNESNLMAEITKIIENPIYFDFCLQFKTRTIDKKKTTRFRLPEICRIQKDINQAYFELLTTDLKKTLGI